MWRDTRGLDGAAAIQHRGTTRLLLAGTLGVASAGTLFSSSAICVPPERTQQEILVTAPRPADAAMAAKVETALQQNPYIYADHVTVVTENGTVRLGGVVRDIADLYAILQLARRIAGKGRVLNEIEYQPADFDGN